MGQLALVLGKHVASLARSAAAASSLYCVVFCTKPVHSSSLMNCMLVLSYLLRASRAREELASKLNASSLNAITPAVFVATSRFWLAVGCLVLHVLDAHWFSVVG